MNKPREYRKSKTDSSEYSFANPFRSLKTFARSAALTAALGMGVAACSSSPRSETGSRPDAAGEMDGGVPAGDAGEPDVVVPGPDAGPAPDADEEEPDFDRDGVPNDKDICLAGNDNDDSDTDGLPRACDPCPNTRPLFGRSAAEDNDGDGVGTRCDLDDTPITGFDPSNSDADLDRVLDRNDNCYVPNGAPQVDMDGDGAGTPCDCNDNDPTVHPGVPARIPAVSPAADTPGDGVDSNCDGIGQQVGPPNADGTVVIDGESTYTCISGTTRDDPDGIATGECEVGTQTCTSFPGGSAFGAVTGNFNVAPEVCDGLDNDCDGSNDEDIICDCAPGATQACGEDEGECEPGEQTCGADRTWGECVGGVGPAESETCDGDDENCNGETDENFGVGETCIGVGACGIGGAGVKECASPSTVRCSTNPGGSADRSTAEACDSVDNNCNGSVDEGSYSVVGGAGTAAVGTACSLPGLCGPGTHRCADTGAVECSSADIRVQSPGFLESPAYCNGLDDDCDGQADEGCDCVDGEEALVCGVSTGACNPGIQLCEGGSFSPDCTGTFVGPEAETCNGVDDNCDGIIDNISGRVAGAACTGVGRCGDIAGVLQCVSSDALGCSTMPGGAASRAIAEQCNGVDDDCDGSVDEGNWPGVGAVGMACSLPGECGSGATRCDTTAATECSSNDRVSTDGPPGGACDARDNDCDGATDEGCACVSGTTRVCGESEGACAEGTQSCSAGAWGDCVGDVVPAPELCDGVDNNCDGLTDNGFGVGDACRGRTECGVDTPGTPADEGLGAVECATTTTTRCSVNPGGTSDQSTEERCNGLDDNCDGRVDEHLDIGEGCRLPGACGAGVNRCRDEFNSECSSEDARGLEIPANGLDDDCDGDVDE